MKMNRLFFRVMAVLLAISAGLPIMAQGVIVYKKNGTFEKFPYEQIDSIVTYNYDDPDLVPATGDGKFTVNGVTFKMVFVEGGTFFMGSSRGEDIEKPVHSVTLSDYMIGETEVTQELWKAVMDDFPNPSYFIGDVQRPVEQVSWDDCQKFIEKLNELTGEHFSLPTEAQWEYAARGGKYSEDYQYSGSNTIDGVAWYISNSSSTTHPVKTKQSNELGLYDMSGNVLEWCQDWFSGYTSSSVVDPVGPSTRPGSETGRVARGGSWYVSFMDCTVSRRTTLKPTVVGRNLGFRLALPVFIKNKNE